MGCVNGDCTGSTGTAKVVVTGLGKTQAGKGRVKTPRTISVPKSNLTRRFRG